MAADTPASAPTRHRPRSTTVFVAAFVAGAAAAVGVNRALDVHLSQAKPQVECEPIFVALRSLPQGVPVTVWDVALRDWPKAMMPATALRVTDSFEGCRLKYPLREGQPLLAGQLLVAEVAPPAPAEPTPVEPEEELVEEAFVPPPPAVETAAAPAADVTTVSTPGQPAEPTPVVTHAAQVESPTTAAVASAPVEEPAAAPTPAPEPSAPLPMTAIADAPPAPAVAGQPTLAAPAEGMAVAEPEESDSAAATAVAAQPDVENRLADDLDAAFDVPSRPAVDLANIPSVMSKADDAAAPSADDAGSAANVRYLVVPERIARQADTSFTTPMAPEGRPVAEPAAPAATAAETASRAEPRAQPAVSEQRAAGQPQRSAAGPAPPRRPQGQQPQQPQQPKAKPQQSRGQPQPKAVAESQQTSPRAWGGAFPNVSAGLEAIGTWRSRVREAVAPERPTTEAPPQRR